MIILSFLATVQFLQLFQTSPVLGCTMTLLVSQNIKPDLHLMLCTVNVNIKGTFYKTYIYPVCFHFSEYELCLHKVFLAMLMTIDTILLKASVNLLYFNIVSFIIFITNGLNALVNYQKQIMTCTILT